MTPSLQAMRDPRDPREAWRRHVRLMTRTLQAMQKWRAREAERLALASEARRHGRARARHL